MADIDRIRRPEERVVQVAVPAGPPAEAEAVGEAGRPSIAVLPFANMSGDPEQEYFADGMVEEITTGLSRIRWLDVIARNSSFIYKGKAVDIRAVGRELSVRYVLEGSVRKAGDKVRITGQLIEADTGKHLWADKFDGALADVFDLQDRITAAVVGAIEPNVRKAEIERMKRKRPDNLDAYDLYLQALSYAYMQSAEERKRAIELLEQALICDLHYAEAHGLAGYLYAQRYMWEGRPTRDAEAALSHARAVATSATDDAATFAFAAMAFIVGGREHDMGLALADRAMMCNPNSPAALGLCAAVHAVSERPERAIELAERALRLSPLDPMRGSSYTAMAQARIWMDDYEGALAAADSSLKVLPHLLPGHVARIVSLVGLGRIEDARAAGVELLRFVPGWRIGRNSPAPSMVVFRDRLRAKIWDALQSAGLPE